MLSGCGNTLVATVEPFCEAVRDVRVSKDDRLTEGTAKQIRQNAEGRRRIGCKDDPAPATGWKAKITKAPGTV